MKLNKNLKILLCIVAVALVAVIGLFIFLIYNKNAVDYKKLVNEDNAQKAMEENEKLAQQDAFAEYTVWTTDGIKFRESPDAEGEIISTIGKREELRVVGEEEGWLKVEFDGKTGYVSKQYTTTEEPTSTGKIVCIDAGHQRYGDSTKEPNGPGSSSMKARVTGGTSGRTTGVSEYELNLDIALKLQEELEARGYEVVMTRTSHDVNISNKERAEVANSAGADITIRIHANGSDNTGVSGALTMAPSSSNPYCSNIANESYDLSRDIIDQYCAATGMKNQGVTTTDTMTGINWCQMPVTIIEMGYMTNATDDTNMQDPDYQSKMVIGIANGVDAYFGL